MTLNLLTRFSILFCLGLLFPYFAFAKASPPKTDSNPLLALLLLEEELRDKERLGQTLTEQEIKKFNAMVKATLCPTEPLKLDSDLICKSKHKITDNNPLILHEVNEEHYSFHLKDHYQTLTLIMYHSRWISIDRISNFFSNMKV